MKSGMKEPYEATSIDTSKVEYVAEHQHLNGLHCSLFITDKNISRRTTIREKNTVTHGQVFAFWEPGSFAEEPPIGESNLQLVAVLRSYTPTY